MRVLPDTNIWIQHLRTSDKVLCDILEYNFVVMHPLVIGELAVVDYPHRRGMLSDLATMPMTYDITMEETLHFVAERKLYSKGIQWNDAVILSSILLTDGVKLWTRDRKLRELAEAMGVAYNAV